MKYRHPLVEAEVIENRLTLSKWGEAILSVSTKHPDHIHNLYPIRKPKPSNKIRWIDLGAINPIDIPVGYELSRHITHPNITITTSWSNQPAMMYFGNVPANRYVGKVDIPEFRAVSKASNPFYMDSGLVLIDIQYNGHPMIFQRVLNEATKQILKEEYDIDSYNIGEKLYYSDNGKDVKISSPETNEGHTWTYINIDTNYLKAYDYYIVEKDIRDPYAYGMKKKYPNVSNNVVKKVVKRFVELANLELYKDGYSDQEIKEISRLSKIHSSKNWVRNAIRSDAGWHHFDDEGHEYEIILEKKPESNIIPMAVETKNLAFYYQGKSETTDGIRPVHVEGSYAVYHADESRHHINETGKFGHIYRPWIKDADGNKVWCEFNKDFNGINDLEIHVPQSFLDNAKYPLTIDPTFGYTTAGGTAVDVMDNSGGAAYRFAFLFNNPGFDGKITQFGVFLSPYSYVTEIDYYMGLYDTAGLNRLDYTARQVITAGSLGNGAFWSVMNSQINYNTSASGLYDIAFFSTVGASNPSIYNFIYLFYDTTTSAGGIMNITSGQYTYPATSEPNNYTISNYKWSMYVSYNPIATVAWLGQ